MMLMLALVAQALGQNPAPQQEPSAEDEEVVRITTNLIQVDATVTDKDGRQVTDLRADEFEILENGKGQTITNFSYVALAPVAAKPAKPTTPPDKNAPPVPPTRLRPEQVQRTIALVVDDLGLSFESTHFVQSALKKFVNEQMQPGDLVAIVRTGSGMGALQQFTSDKRVLSLAIDNLRWNRLGRGGLSPFAPLRGQTIADELGAGTPGASGEDGSSIDEFRNELFTVGTLGALSYIVQGLTDLPGRKSVMLFSDGIKIVNQDGQGLRAADIVGTSSVKSRSNRILDSLRRLTELANRASVVIYTMDVRGLQVLGVTAADNTRGLDRPGVQDGLVVNPLEESMLTRRADFFESQQGLNFLAQQTGGIAIRNNNDLNWGIKKMLEDQQGYYLIGYRPDEETFDPKRARFNKLQIKVKRPGLKVRYRSGFFGVTDEEMRPPVPQTRAEQLSRAIIAPFASGDLDVRLTSLFANDAKTGSFMRSLLHVDSRNLTFVEEADGWHKVTFDVMAVTFGDNGVIVDQASRTHNMRVRGETYQRIMQSGFDYIMTVPIKKAGAYQLRAALRDSATQRVGSASQFIEVPDIGKNRLTLSGIIVNGFDPQKRKNNASSGAAAQNAEGTNAESDPLAVPAVRIFRRGMVLEFGYVIYNAQPDKATHRPQLQTQLRVFRDGQQIYAGNVLSFDAGAQTDLKRLSTGGRLQLGTDMTPGDYVLQLVVTDLLAKGKHGTATQWIDFQVVDK
jgi:VWFA-related protein